jgi:hypothetical protein
LRQAQNVSAPHSLVVSSAFHSLWLDDDTDTDIISGKQIDESTKIRHLRSGLTSSRDIMQAVQHG